MSEIIKLDNPFRRSQGKHIQIMPGRTIEEICKQKLAGDIKFDCEYVTVINGQVIDISDRGKRKLKEGEYLLIVPKVADDGKSIINTIAFVALFAISGGLSTGITQLSILGIPFYGATAAGIFQVAVIVGGGMLINSLQPHPKKPSSGFIDSEQSQSFGWNPVTVQRQGIPIARFYGLNKMFGNVIAAYTEKESDTFEMTTIAETFYYNRAGDRLPSQKGAWFTGTSYSQRPISFDPRKVNLYALFSLSIGPMRELVVVDSLRLNDQKIANLTGVFYEQRPGDISQQRISYFDKTKLEVVVGRLVANGTPITYTTINGNFNDIEIELAFPKGLYDASGGDLANYTVNVTVEIKKTTSSTWTLLADGVNITDNVGDKVIETYTTVAIFAVEYGSNYDIRVTKNTAERDDIKYGDDLYLDKVREIIDRQFIYPRHALVGVKALATDQLSGSIRFSCLSRGLYVRRYSGGAGGAIDYSNNPADVIADILTQPVYSGEHSPWNDLELMLNFEGADGSTNTVDDSPKGNLITFGGSAEIDTAQKKFGSSSVLFDGVDSYIQVANDRKLFGAWNNLIEDWTIDIELRMGDHIGVEVIAGQYVDVNNSWDIWHIHGTGLRFHVFVNGVAICEIFDVGEITDNDWHHIAICKVGNEIGLYKDGTQIGYDTLDSGDGYVFENSDLILGQINSADYLFGWLDHARIQKFNVFSAAPVVGLTDTITEPVAAYTDPGNSYAVARYDGYNPSKLLTADFEDLADWCDDVQVNPLNFGISNISNATQAVVMTTSVHPFRLGDLILFRGVPKSRMIEISDGTIATVLSVTNNTVFTIDLDTSGYTPYDIATRLLFNFEGADGATTTEDESVNGFSINASTPFSEFVSQAQIDTAQYKFGGSSLSTDGTVDYLLLDYRDFDLSDLNIIDSATTNRTIHFFIKFTDHSATDAIVYFSGVGVDSYKLKHVHGSGWIFETVLASVPQFDTGSGGEITDNNWHHVAVCKVADEYGIYVDGSIVAYVQDATVVDVDTNVELLINAELGGANSLNGWTDGFEITHDNIFGAAPDVGLTDTITVPTSASIAGFSTVEEYKPRFAFNGGFDSETNMWEAALRVCELCRCVPFWDGDIIRLAIDKAGSSVYAFTMGNIIKNSFKQRFIPIGERASEIEIHYRDASQDYERQPFTLVNDSIGNVSNKIRLDLFGITDTDMANRLADFKLLQNLNIKSFAMWNSEIDAIACTIGDIVDVQHDVTNWGSIGSGDDPYTGGGRVVFATNITNAVITIDGDIYFDDADWRGGTTSYKILLKSSDDSTPESKTITGVTESSVAGGTFDITVSGVFTANPKRDDIWAAGVATYETKEYRIVNMRQTSEQRVEITAVEYNSAIYAND